MRSKMLSVFTCALALVFTIATPALAMTVKETLRHAINNAEDSSFEALLKNDRVILQFEIDEVTISGEAFDTLLSAYVRVRSGDKRNNIGVSNYTVKVQRLEWKESWCTFCSKPNEPFGIFTEFTLEKFDYLYQINNTRKGGRYTVQEINVKVVLDLYNIDHQWLRNVIDQTGVTLTIDGVVDVVRALDKEDHRAKTLDDVHNVTIFIIPDRINGNNVERLYFY